MTGYGRSEKQNGIITCKVEIRSVNNRFIDINARFPKYLSSLELPLKKLIKSKCSRGSFDVFINIEKNGENGSDLEVTSNVPLAKQYIQALDKIKNELGLSGNFPLEALLNVKDVIKTEPMSLDENQESLVLDSVEEALISLIKMRQEEGNHLQNDLNTNIQTIETLNQQISLRQPQVVEDYKNKLNEKVKTLSEGIELDPGRLAQEVAIFADRCDISEELTRMNCHLKQFFDFLKMTEPMGRKLEFIVQEINREVNTIGSKSPDFEISQKVIEIKSLLEKIREQLQNIE